MVTPPAIEVGFYGKLPSHGDFLRRRVADAFVDVWDAWLQRCIVASRDALGGSWLNVYLTSPVWRYACAAGVFGPQPVLGLMVPSVDRVGRYFHLTLVVSLPDDTDVVAAATAADPFFDAAEQLVIDTLAADRVEFDTFDQQVQALAGELTPVLAPPRVRLDPEAAHMLRDRARGGWQVPIGTPSRLGPVLQQLVGHRLAELYDPLMIWWTEGSSVVEPNCLFRSGLFDPDSFASFLDGSWNRRHWQGVAAHVTRESQEAGDTWVPDAAQPHYRSAGVTDVGRVRQINQDSFLERADVGMWVVADGLGGHRDGEVASRMVCDTLADFVPDGGFDAMIEGASERIQRVNTYLVQAGARGVETVITGTTVAALLVRGNRCAVIWAGDSRVYRLRDGQLDQLTRDHSVAAEFDGEGAGESPNAITRAVGCESRLELDIQRERVRGGDRFLLCSDGLTRTVSDDQILYWMQADDISSGVRGLLAATLEAGAPDNVTVVLVEAYAPAGAG